MSPTKIFSTIPRANVWLRLMIVVWLAGVLFAGSMAAIASELPPTLKAQSDVLNLNGKGYRKKAFLKLYEAGLYLAKPSNNAKTIVADDKATAIRLVITSGLITKEKMTDAIDEGFANSLNGNTEILKEEIAQFLAVFDQGIEEGDIFTLAYTPKLGTQISKNDKVETTIAGLLFKQALFGIWLSDQPADKKLKKSLLGG